MRASATARRWLNKETGKRGCAGQSNSYRFEEAKDGYRLIVEPLSSGSEDKVDPAQELSKKLEELAKFPFVLRLNEDGDILELERGDEYWAKTIRLLREGLSGLEPKGPGHDKMTESIVSLYESMSAETRLAKLTESIRPLVQLAWTETSIGKPVLSTVQTMSPLGPVNQNVAITLTKVRDGFAYITIRSSIPTEELRRLTAAVLDRMNNGALKPDKIAKASAALAAAKGFNVETVEDYQVSTVDGMLETFHSTQTLTVTAADKPERRIKTLSIKRTH